MNAAKVQLGDLVKIAGGGTPSRKVPEYFNGGIPWVTVKDFDDDFFIHRSQENISQLGLEKSASRLIPAGNVILGTRMSVGKAAINLIDVAINQDLKALFCTPQIDALYLTFFLAAAAPRLEEQATGATVKGITIDDIETLEIPLPDLSEQRRITGELERADGLRRTRRYDLELADTFLVSEFPSNLVCEYGHGKMGLPSGLQAGRQWRGRVRHLLALAFGQVRGEPEPFVPVS